VSDDIVDRLIELYRKLENLANAGGNMVDGWRPLRLDCRGRVVAGKSVKGIYCIREFYPTGEWEKAAKYLEIQSEFRSLLFSDLTAQQLEAYRARIGSSSPHA
jgi:hypothetical protein